MLKLQSCISFSLTWDKESLLDGRGWGKEERNSFLQRFFPEKKLL